MNRTVAEALRSVMDRLTGPGGPVVQPFRRPSPELSHLDRLTRDIPGFAFRCADDRHRTIEYVSPSVRRLTGFEPHDLLDGTRVSFAALVHPADRPRLQDVLRRASVAARAYRVTYRLVGLDGRERHVQEIGEPVPTHAGGLAFEGFVTELPELGAERRDRATEVHRVGAVVHDLNNALAIVRTTADVVGAERRQDRKLARDLADITSAVDRAAALTRELARDGRSDAATATQDASPEPPDAP